MQLYPFQKEAVKFHLEHRYTLNCSEMGLGKSCMALEAARASGLPVAIFAPPFLRAAWTSEGEKVGVSFDFYPYSTLHNVVASGRLRNSRFWIADEVHLLKTPTTRRTHAFYSLLKTIVPDYFVGLTGTPIKNRVPDFWTLLAFCKVNPQATNGKHLEGHLTKFRAFSRHFCYVEAQKIRGFNIEKYTGIRKDRLGEFRGLLRDKLIRYRVEEVLQDLPDMTRKLVELELTPTEGLESAFDDYLANKSISNPTAKRLSALSKADSTSDYVRGMIEEGSGPVVVFTDHVESAQKIAEGVPGARVITGSTAMEERMRLVNWFQTGVGARVLVATIGTMSVGVTLTAARHVVFNDESWVPADNLQAEKRIHRIGQKFACWSHVMIATKTDGYISNTLRAKLETINTALP